MSGVQEATSGVVNVADFDSNTVRRMLAYIYTGNYDDGSISGAGAGAAMIGATMYGKAILKAACFSSPKNSTDRVIDIARVSFFRGGLQGLARSRTGSSVHCSLTRHDFLYDRRQQGNWMLISRPVAYRQRRRQRQP